jgi:hypothetical protein
MKNITFTIVTLNLVNEKLFKNYSQMLYKNNKFVILDYDANNCSDYISGYLDAYTELDFNVTIKFMELDIDNTQEFYNNFPRKLSELKKLSKK